jgi:hypothetical protein
MKKFLIVCCSLLYILLVKAQAPKYSNAFLGIGVGARAMGMGNSIVASSSDIYSAYWNPAGLLHTKSTIEFGLMHNEQFAGIAKHDFIGASYALNDKSRLAISMIRYGIDGIPNTLYLMQNGQINYQYVKEFSAVDYAFIGSYATQTKIENLTCGANVKLIRRTVGDFGGAWGFGIDAAAKYKVKDYQFSLVGYDITGTFNAWSFQLSAADQAQLLATGNTLPKGGLEITTPKFVLGAARQFHFFQNKFSVQPELNVAFTTDGQRNVLLNNKIMPIDPRIGLELGYKNKLFLRGGLQNIQKVKSIDGISSYQAMPSIGAGFRFNQFAIDYALGNAFNQGFMAMSNIVSVQIGLNKGQ